MNLRDFLSKHEGRKNQVYRDPVGLLTVGVGHRIVGNENLKLGDIISDEEIEHYLTLDIEAAKRGVLRHIMDPLMLGPHQLDALISFVFNLGVQRLKTSTLLALINQERKEEAAKEFDKWVYGTVNGRKIKLPGLVSRRAEERLMFEGKLV